MGEVIAWILVSSPSAVYLLFAASYFVRGRSRREQVQQLLDVDTVRTFYAKAYRVTRQDDLATRVLPHWTEHVLPLGLCAAVTLPISAIGAIVAGLPLALPSSLVERASGVPTHVLAGFAGAYLWGLQACIDRFRVVNWTPSFIHGLWVRLLIGGALGALVAFPFKSEYAPLLAFGLGAFPAATVRKWLQNRTAKIIGLDDADASAGPKWSTIQGVTPELLDRLSEADVASPAALANADPFRLFLRTNITWRHILDLIDQAILVGYIGEKIDVVRPMGIRGSIEMGLLAERLVRLNPDDERHKPVIASAQATIAQISKALGHDGMDVTRTLIQNLDEDSQVELVWNLWFEEEAKGVISDGLESSAEPRVHVTHELEVGPRPGDRATGGG